MNIAQRDAAIIKDRLEGKGTLEELGAKYHITGSRVHQITQPFLEQLPQSLKPVHRVNRRLVLTKKDIARRFNVPTERLEIRV